MLEKDISSAMMDSTADNEPFSQGCLVDSVGQSEISNVLADQSTHHNIPGDESPVNDFKKQQEELPIFPENYQRNKAWEQIFGNMSNDQACFLSVSNKTSQTISELRVIEQDVMRTRTNEPYFEHKSIQYIMKRVLMKYCGFYSIQYMQGLNEILAPLITFGNIRISRTAEKLLQYISIKNELSQSSFILSSTTKSDMNGRESKTRHFDKILSPTNDGTDSEEALMRQHMLHTEDVLNSWDIIISNIGDDDCVIFIDKVIEEDFSRTCYYFEKIVDLLAPTIYRWADVQSLQTQLASLHLLLYYFDAEFSKYLSNQSMSVDIYAQSWLITLFARRLPVELVLYLWDLLIQVDNPCFIIFLAVAYLSHHKTNLMSLSMESLPETIVRMNFLSASEVDAVFHRALFIMNATPASVISDISKYAFDRTVLELERISGYYDLMFRPCIVVDANDVAVSLTINSGSTDVEPVTSPFTDVMKLLHTDPSSEDQQSSLHVFRDINPSNRYLLIDCRQNQDYKKALFIQGSLNMSSTILEEIHAAVQYDTAVGLSLFDSLSPEAASILALLWSCREDNLHYCIFGDGIDDHHFSPPGSPSHSSNKPNSNIEHDDGDVLNSSNESLLNIVTHSGLDAVTRFKKNQSKVEVKLPQFRLATALLILGFSRVSVIRGFNDSSSDLIYTVDDSENDDVIPNMKRKLCQRCDGFTSLVYNLHYKLGAPIEKGVVRIHQDIMIAEKVRKFYLSSAYNNSFNHRNNPAKSTMSEYLSTRMLGFGMSELDNVLGKLSGFRANFFEGILLNNLKFDNISTKLAQTYDSLSGLSFTSQTNHDDEKESYGPCKELSIRTATQSKESGVHVTQSINKLSGKFSKVSQDLTNLKNKFSDWKRGFDIVSMNADATHASCKKLTAFSSR